MTIPYHQRSLGSSTHDIVVLFLFIDMASLIQHTSAEKGRKPLYDLIAGWPAPHLALVSIGQSGLSSSHELSG